MSDIDRKIRVLIADDSFFIRRYLTELMNKESDIEVVGIASDGEEVIELARRLKPDVITMDFHMPKKNGLEATAEIMLGERPLPAIIMLSAFDGEDGERVRRSLLRSGAEILSKPSGEISLDIEQASQPILERVRRVGRVEIRMKRLYEEAHRYSDRTSSARSSSLVVVLGASTGGPPLIEHLLSLVSNPKRISFIIVQHMSSYFTDLFAERLDRVTEFDVREAKNGDVALPGSALVVPGGSYLTRKDGERSLSVVQNQDAKLSEIDRTMSAIAELYGSRCCGVLLSGMGDDGIEGMSAIHRRGGVTIVQDPEEAAVSSMPERALNSVDVDAVLPASEIPSRLDLLSASGN